MSKKYNESTATATEATETTETTESASEATETRAKAPAGSSINAQAKTLVKAVRLELNEKLAALSVELDLETPLMLVDVLTEHTAEWLNKVADELASVADRGAPLPERLASVNAEINLHYASMPIVDGKAVASPEWDDKTRALLTRRANIERAIRAANAPKDETAE